MPYGTHGKKKKRRKNMMEGCAVIGGRHIGPDSKKVVKKIITKMVEANDGTVSDDVVNRSPALVKWVQQLHITPMRWFRPGKQQVPIKGVKGIRTSNRSLLK